MKRPVELFACLYVRELPAQALLRQQPELHNRACAVLGGKPPSQTVCALNTKARLMGVTHGMSRVEVETFPATVILTRSCQAERAMQDVLLEAAGEFSPRIEDRSGEMVFVCGIDIAGTERVFGPPEVLAKILLRRVRRLGISARVTVSRNFHTAVCLAKGLPPSVSLSVVQDGAEANALASLPINVLQLSEDQAETFASWGIRTLGMLASLPNKALISRLGQDGGRLRQLAHGELPHLFQPVRLPFRLEERRELDFPLDDLESLLFGLALMLNQLILRATARVMALASASVQLSLDGGGTHSVMVQPALPTNDKHLWFKLLRHKLEADPPTASIVAVVLHADPGVTNKVQLGLFSPQLPEPGRLNLTLARIAAVVGEDNVGRAVLEDTNAHNPFRMERFKLSSDDLETTKSVTPRACCRPLRPRERTRVTVQRAKPSVFFFRNLRYTVEHAYGPWKDSGGWWNSNLWSYEQWDLVARGQDGTLLCCCLMRDLVQNEWQMAALYD